MMILDRKMFIIIRVLTSSLWREFIKNYVDENILAFDIYVLIKESNFYNGRFDGYYSYRLTLGTIHGQSYAFLKEFVRY